MYKHWKKHYLIRLFRNAAIYKGFVGLIIQGHEGAGKTVAALKLAEKVYGNYKTALNMLVFSLKEFEELLDLAGKNRIPLLIWDDAGVYADRYLWRYDPITAADLSSTIQLIRTYCATLILTVPNEADLTRVLRFRRGWLVAEIWRLSKWWSYMKVYQITVNPLGQAKARRLVDIITDEVFEGKIYLRLPDWVYERYWDRRLKWRSMREKYLRQKRKEKKKKGIGKRQKNKS